MEYGTCLNLPRAGHPQKLSDRARRRLVREATKTPTTTLKELKASVAQMGETVHTTTVSRVLHQSKLYGRVAKRKPLLKNDHMKSRLGFAQRHVLESKVNWKKVLWFDEAKIELFVHQTRHYVWQTPNTAHCHKYTISTVKHGGGSIMLWGCFAAADPGRLVKVEGNTNAEKYRQILEDNLTQSARELQLGRRFIFLQDNNPKHIAKGECFGVAKSKPRSQSNREFVSGLEKSCSRPIPEEPDRA
uniref:Transposase Tc1-like domain-containing protein n=1 Tax=Dicentrarchus labrax TaxID=13489 RepID=A0A8P4FYI4_DICLA